MNKKILSLITLSAVSAMTLTACPGGIDHSKPSEATIETTVTLPVEQTAETSVAAETREPCETSVVETTESTPGPDVTAPFLLAITRDAYITVGETFDINNFISYIDDRDPDVTLTVEGSVDTNVTGTYPLNFVMTDDAGNVATDSIIVNVVEPVDPSSTEPYSGEYTFTGTSFSDFMAAYPGENIHYGIDVSHWQGSINFEAVKEAGCEFVIVRAGYSSDGQFHQDEYFTANMEGAAAAGLPVGIYVYTSDNTPEDIDALADVVCELASGYNVALPICFDWESFSQFQQYHMSIENLNELYRVFRDNVEEYGYTTILYGSKYYLDVIWDDEFENVWLAHYNSVTDYTGSYLMWQQSSSGQIPGIDAYVDMDLYYGDLPAAS